MTHDSFLEKFVPALGHRSSDDSGQTILMAALMVPVLIAAVGLAANVGSAFDHRRQMQSAADSGAMAGTRALMADSSISAATLASIVNADVTRNGFVNGANGVTVTVCRPGVDVDCPTQYVYDAVDIAVRVTIEHPRPTFFSGLLGWNSWNVGVKAVAASAPTGMAKANIVILDDQCTSATFNAVGGAPLTIAGRVWVNSCDQNAAKANGGGDIIAADGVYLTCNLVGVCGGYTEGGGSQFVYPPILGNAQIPDPLAALPEPTPTGPIYADPKITTGTHTLYPGIYNQGIDIKGGTVTFAPGIYFISNQPLSLTGGATILGDGVMFYAYNGASLSVQNPTTLVTMSAPASGTYRGIWYFQERANATDAKVTGRAQMNVAGVFYIANSQTTLAFDGNTDSGGSAPYTAFVVWRFTISGGATFNGDYSSIGGPPLKSGPALCE